MFVLSLPLDHHLCEERTRDNGHSTAHQTMSPTLHAVEEQQLLLTLTPVPAAICSGNGFSRTHPPTPPNMTFSHFLPGFSGINLWKAIESGTLSPLKHSLHFELCHYTLPALHAHHWAWRWSFPPVVRLWLFFFSFFFLFFPLSQAFTLTQLLLSKDVLLRSVNNTGALTN